MLPRTSLVALCLSAFLCSCAISIERPDSPLSGLGLATDQGKPPREIDDKTIADAFAKKEQLQWPARLAVARLGSTKRASWQANNRLTNVPTSEQALIDVRFPKGPQWSNLVHLSPMLGLDRETNLAMLRLEAARTHADLLLVYGISTEEASAPNPLAILNLLILPAFVLPGSNLETLCVGGMALVDVRNGYVYALTGQDERKTCSAPSAAKRGSFEDLYAEATSGVVGRMLDNVARQIPSRPIQ